MAGEIQEALEEMIFQNRTEREKADFQKTLAIHHARKLAREIGRLSSWKMKDSSPLNRR